MQGIFPTIYSYLYDQLQNFEPEDINNINNKAAVSWKFGHYSAHL